MALLHLKIFGREIDDALLAKLIIGSVCVFVLLLFLGITAFGTWVQNGLIIYIASILFLVPLTHGLLEEEFEAKHIYMMIGGFVFIVIYLLTSKADGLGLIINILKAIVFATILSIFLEPFVKRLKGTGHT